MQHKRSGKMLLTQEEVAKKLRVHRSTLYRWHKNDSVPKDCYHRMGRRYLYDFDKWLRKKGHN